MGGNVTIGGVNVPTGANGTVKLDGFEKAGGVFKQAYDNVAARLGTQDDRRIDAEIAREYRAQTATPDNAADTILADNRRTGRGGDPIKLENIAAELVAMRRDNPDQARAVESAIMDKLGAGDQSRLQEDIKRITQYAGQADSNLQQLGADAAADAATNANAAPARALSKQDVSQKATQMLADATWHQTSRTGHKTDGLDVSELSYQVQKIAADNRALAQSLRFELTGRMSPMDAADFNRKLAGDTYFLEGAGTALSHPVDGAIGIAKGIGNGFLAIGDILVRGSTYQAAGDQMQAAGLQSLIGNDDFAKQLTDSATSLQGIASRPMVEQISYDNIAQSGGGDIGTVIDLATGVKGIASAVSKGTAKAAAHSADELAEVTGKQADEATDIAKAATRPLDQFDQIAANAKIDLPHILNGHTNAKGKAVGFHSRPDGIDPAGSRMTQQVESPNQHGIYVGKVEVFDATKGQWIPKTSNNGTSTFYPDTLSPQEIESSIRHAYADALRQDPSFTSGLWRGRSEHGFEIEGAFRNGQIVTAYPIYTK